MKKIVLVLAVVFSVLVGNAQQKGLKVVTGLNGPIMLENIEQPDDIFSDVVFDNQVIFEFDLEKGEIRKKDRGETEIFKIEERYKNVETDKVLSMSFYAGGRIIVFTMHKETEDSEHFVTVQETIEYMEYQVDGKAWYVQMYFAGTNTYDLN